MKNIVFVKKYEYTREDEYFDIDYFKYNGIEKEKLSLFGTYYLGVINNSKDIILALKEIIDKFKLKSFETNVNFINIAKEVSDLDNFYIRDFIKFLQLEVSLELEDFKKIKKDTEDSLVTIERMIKEYNDELKKDDESMKNTYIENCHKYFKQQNIYYSEEKYRNNLKKSANGIREEYMDMLKTLENSYNNNIESLNNIFTLEGTESALKNTVERALYYLECNVTILNLQYNLMENNLKIDEYKKQMSVYQEVFDYRMTLPKSEVVYVIEDEKKISLSKITDYNMIDKIHNVEKNDNKLIEYKVSTITELLNIYLDYFFTNKIPIKKCKNCGKYFIPNNKQVYCDNTSPQNQNKSCKTLSDDMRNNKSPVYELYRSNYKTQSSKKRRNINNIPNIEKKFDKWNKLAKEKMRECEEGNITIEEYKKWLKESQDWIKNL